MKRFGFLSALAAIALAMHASPAAAGTIVNADSASTAAAPVCCGLAIGNIVDGSGLSAALTDANFTTVTHTVGFAPTEQWLTGATEPDVTFTFNSAVTLDQVLIWNYTQFDCCETRGADTFGIQVDTGTGFGSTIFSMRSLAR